jgi:membrane protein insertase Oxa1/YidC/SpoIIIJ
MKMLSQGKVVEKKKEDGVEPDFATIMNKQMLYMGPILTLFIGVRYSSALSLYWLVSTIFSIAQQWFLLKGTKDEGER